MMTDDALKNYRLAKRVTLQAIENLPPLIDTGWIARKLDNTILKQNDNLTLLTFSGKVPFRVIGMKYYYQHDPSASERSSNEVKVTSETRFVLISADKRKKIL